ncbi:MAG: hypothetical protein JW774_11415 [Candidatus Aureabacteria bacterium]|nr:hypothetical protein [Candidatus Auribacterota bacterium]
MRIIAFIDHRAVVEKILRHLKLWEEQESSFRASPPEEPEIKGTVFEPCLDDFQNCQEELPLKYLMN